MILTYKTATVEDAELIAALAEKIWKDHYISIITLEQIDYMLGKMYSPESLARQMKEGHVFTILYSGEAPAGYISMSTKDQKNYFLHKFYVTTGGQRKGIGTQALADVVAALGKIDSLELTVNRKNFKAINFYFKNGFVIKDVADFDIGNGYFMNDFIMLKKLHS